MTASLNAVSHLWWSWMGTMFWQASLLILIVGAVDFLIRRWAWPQVRHALWLLVLLKLVIPPTWSLPGAPLPRVTEPVLNKVVARWAPDTAAEPAHVEKFGLEIEIPTETVPAAIDQLARRSLDSEERLKWTAYAFVIWLFGMALFSALLVRRTAKLRRWHREQEQKRTIPPWFLDLMLKTARQLGLERLPAIVFSDEVSAPAVYGLFHPVLLLPAHSTELSPEEAEHVLLHELAHLKRGDLWMHGFCLVLQGVYWFNPLLIWARRQIKHVRELCCDLTVANLLREKTMAYRQTLLDTARRLLTESVEPGLALLGVFEEPFRLVSRLRWLERESWKRRTPSFVAAFFVLALGAPLLLPMAPASDMGGSETGAWPSLATGLSGGGGSQSDAPTASDSRPAVYVRNEFVGQELVLGIPFREELLAVSETWVGDDIIAGTERGRTVIVDRSRGSLTYIDHKHKFWTQTPLPLDIELAMCEHSLARRAERRSSGEVAATRHSKRILGRKCREYRIHSWYVDADRIHTEEWIKVWASTDVPFDLSLYDLLLLNLRLIYNRDAVYRSELEKIEGLQMRLELSEGSFLFGRRYADEVVKLEERPAPAGVFSPPVGYERRDRIEDLEF